MDEHELREWLARELGEHVPDSIWALLRQDGYLHAEDDGELQDLLNRAEQLLQTFDPKPMRKRRRRMTASGEVSLPAVLSPYERQRRDVMNDYYAKIAGALPEVRRFRKDALRGKFLRAADVLNFANSHAARAFSIEEFHGHGIPLRHKAEVLAQRYVEGQSYSSTILVTPPGRELRFRFELMADEPFWGRNPGTQKLQVAVDRMTHECSIFRGSLLDKLRGAAQTLESVPWQKGGAATFILTGEAPPFFPMMSNMSMAWGAFGGHGKITLDIEAWMSATSVARMYARAQQKLFGRHNRPLSERRMELFRFVTLTADEDLNLPPFRELMDAWNKGHRKWPYHDVRNFSRDYWAARRALTFPDFIDFMGRMGVTK